MCVWQSGGLDHSASPDLAGGQPPNPDHTQLSPPLLCLLPLSPENKTERRQCSRDGWRDWQRMGRGEGGHLGAYVCSDTFSLFLFSRPVLIISILGHRGSPNIEPVLIDQACINKPRQCWQHVSRGRGQIGCTDCLLYQGQASLGASGWVCGCVCILFIAIQD